MTISPQFASSPRIPLDLAAAAQAPIAKRLIQCHGYTAAMGGDASWECPSCHAVYPPPPAAGNQETGDAAAAPAEAANSVTPRRIA